MSWIASFPFSHYYCNTSLLQITAFIGTWNVNAKGSENDSLRSWLAPVIQSQATLVAIGFQEIVDLNAVNVAVDNKTQQRTTFWCDKMQTELPAYTLVGYKSMVGLLLAVYIHTSQLQNVRHVQTASVGVGVMGLMGNKGAVAVRLHLVDATLCFVCSHLAAHRENVTGRNTDFANCTTKLQFDVGETVLREMIRNGSLPALQSATASSLGLDDHEHVIWLGDLNYRIDESLSTEQVLKMAADPASWAALANLDQLNIERAAGRAFAGYSEGVLQFAPTYKYQPGTHHYDQRPDKKVRAPAWCDRILWKSRAPVTQVAYGRSEEPACSDHKAVYAVHRLTIAQVVPAQREAVYTQLSEILDRYENETLPTVGLDKVALDFGAVRYGQTVPLTLSITNTGSVVAAYRMVAKPEESVVCKPWLTVTPTYGMLIPGDPAAVLDIKLTISAQTAHVLNSGREVLDDILILRLENGRDYYITVKAAYARSCFGMSADELVLYAEPIRSVPLDPLSRPPPTTALCVPKEVWRLVDAICEKGLTTPQLFGIVETKDVPAIREALDTGAVFGMHSIHGYATALQALLKSFSQPIVPAKLYPTVEMDSTTIQSSARRLLEELPPVHYNIFVYIVSFFREVLQHRDVNLVTAAKMARLACACLCADTDAASKRTGMQLIVLHLLETSSI